MSPSAGKLNQAWTHREMKVWLVSASTWTRSTLLVSQTAVGILSALTRSGRSRLSVSPSVTKIITRFRNVRYMSVGMSSTHTPRLYRHKPSRERIIVEMRGTRMGHDALRTPVLIMFGH